MLTNFMNYSRSKIRLFNKKQIKQISLWLVAVVAFELLFFPIPTLAGQTEEPAVTTTATSLNFNLETNNIVPRDLAGDRWSLRLPQEEVLVEDVKKVEGQFSGRLTKSRKVVLTAYNSDKAQCDNSPCITANGFNVCKHGIEDTVAANFLPMGTKIRIPALFGDRIFVVRDRMAKRHQNRVDIWMKNYSSAIKFGIKTATIEIVPTELASK